MKILRIICAVTLLFSLVFHFAAPAVFAIGNSNDGKQEDASIYTEYCREMKSMGFSDEETNQLSNWSRMMAEAESMSEVDSLMEEYDALVAGTSLDRKAVSSIPSDSGGTLQLRYTGNLSIWSNVIYTKVIYFSAEQTLALYHTAFSKDVLDFWESYCDDIGIGIVTEAVAAKFAAALMAALGITSTIAISIATSVIGFSLGFIVFVVRNLDKWDLADAVERSDNGKIKLEYYYLQQSSEPYYISIRNYEPWNSNYIEIPDHYDYTWYEGIYSDDDVIHVHDLQYSSYANGTHAVWCNNCAESFDDDCFYSYTYLRRGQHSALCQHCGYSIARLPCLPEYQYCGNGIVGDKHQLVCKDCLEILNTTTISCTLVATYYGVYNGVASHIDVCSECGHQDGVPQPCDSDISGKCSSCGGG